jgi:hypothetical protein
MSDDGLLRIVTEPLRLAGVPEASRMLLGRAIQEEVGSRPGDLALVQMALTETWNARNAHGGNLLAAYAAIGRVEGALAKAAEDVREHQLEAAAHRDLSSALDTVLVRLVRLGDTGGATRRQATRDEFDEVQWRLVQVLASEQGKRLVLLGGSTELPSAEIAHEALVTAWPYFQNLLQSVVDDKRILDALIAKAKAWFGVADALRAKRLATGIELEWFGKLNRARPEWLSSIERQFIATSQAAVDRQHVVQQRLRWGLQATAIMLIAAFVVVAIQYVRVRDALTLANGAIASSIWNQLDFSEDEPITSDELNALWAMRLSTNGVVDASLEQLRQNSDRAVRLGRRPGPILRAHFLQWRAAELDSVFGAVVKAFRGRTDPAEFDALASALEALPGKLNYDEAQTVFSATLKALPNHADGTTSEALRKLVGKLPPQEAERTVVPLVNAIKSSPAADYYSTTVLSEPIALEAILTALAEPINDAELRSLALALEQMAKREEMTPEQALIANKSFLQAIQRQPTVRARVTVTPSALALATRLPPSQAHVGLEQLLKTIEPTGHSKAIEALESVRDALTGSTSTEKTNASLRRVLEALGEATGFDDTVVCARYALASALQELADVLAGEEASKAFATATRELGRNIPAPNENRSGRVRRFGEFPSRPDRPSPAEKPSVQYAQHALASGMRALARRLLTDQIPTAAQSVLDILRNAAISGHIDTATLQALTATVTDMAEKLSPAQALDMLVRALHPFADAIRSITSAGFDALGSALLPLVHQLDGNRAKTALDLILQMITTPDAVGSTIVAPAIAKPAQELAAKVSIAQTDDALSSLLAFLGQGKEDEDDDDDQNDRSMVDDEPRLRAVAAIGHALASRLTASDIERHTSNSETDVNKLGDNQLNRLAVRMTVLADQRPAHNAQADVTFLAQRMHEKHRPVVLRSLIGAVQALAARLQPEQRDAAEREIRSVLAWSTEPETSSAAAEALIALLRNKRPEPAVIGIVEALKYPTAAGDATDLLLAALQQVVAGAPGKNAGLAANLDWVKATYPTIKVDTPPSCPQPFWPGLTCPATP